MLRRRIPQWLSLLCIGLAGSVWLPVSAQDDPTAAGSDLFYSVLLAG
jgi:hypothetical protein